MKNSFFANHSRNQYLVAALLALSVSSIAKAECVTTQIEGGTLTQCQSGSDGNNINSSNYTVANNTTSVNSVQQTNGSFDLSQLDSFLSPYRAPAQVQVPAFSLSSFLFRW